MIALTPKIVKDGTSDQRALLPPPCCLRDLICVYLRYLRTDLGGWVEIRNPKSEIRNFEWAAGYALGFNRHIVANNTVATTAHATIESITINHAVCNE